ncbi:hypothetical protein [Myroides marinus]|uniref:hypothetical protein n=1 Tax=Myroides marinus TaxID=703342 RepID=UPI002576E212|nr:hypothetical protein [Myroides marinus]MDM1346491.1 hypothetical protein [Myroides marinus]MDM1349910.1 hypothetical protein [Myroides marinus]MDM1357118.1 hypothetical protein [Myroides marinus]
MEVDIVKQFYNKLLSALIEELDKQSPKGDDVDKILQGQINKLLETFIIEGKFIHFSDLSQLIIEKEGFKNKIVQEIDVLDFDKSVIVKNVNSIIDDLHAILIQFINIIKSQLAVSSHIVHKSYSFIETKQSILKEFCEYCNLFILDFSISDDISFFEKLNELFRRFNEIHQITPFTYSIIYEHKINLLKYKWIKRQKYNREFLQKKVRKDYSEKIVSNNDIIDLDSKIKIGEPYYQTYKEWIDKIEYHYFDKNSTEYEFVEDSIRKEGGLTTYDFYLRIKYYKDISNDFTALKGLLGLRDQKNLLYYYNNLFSLFVQREGVDYGTVRKEYLRLKGIFTYYSNNNFFIHYKFLEFVISSFKNDIKSIPKELDFRELNEIVDLCKSNFEWCTKGMNLVYDFNYEECLVEIKEIKVYHASNFLLPLSLVENDYKIKEVESSLRAIEYERDRSKYEGLFNSQSKAVNVEIEKVSKEINDKVEKVSKDSINTITIFTAIISFIVGSVGVYKFVDSFLQALIFILVFGVTISIFVMLVFLNTKEGIQKIRENFRIILGVYLLSFLIIGGLFYLMSTEKIAPTNTQKYLYKKQLDSINSVYREDVIRLQEENEKIRKFYKQLISKRESEQYRIKQDSTNNKK